MPRRIQDIVPGDRRTIKDVPISGKDYVPAEEKPAKQKKASSDVKIHIHRVPEPAQSHMQVTPPVPKKHHRKKRGKWVLITVGVVAVVAVIGYLASTYFSKATFTIVPKVLQVAVNGSFVSQSTATNGNIPYNLVSLHGAATSTIPATDGPSLSTKAQGKVTVYNSFSSSTMRLIAGTRLAGSNGKVYRLTSSVTIPGYTKTVSAVVPGSLSATVVADQPGDSYNISGSDSVSDFKVVAYKGGPKYDAVYARLASSITGGFIGAKKIVSPSAVASTTANIKAAITSSLLTQIKGVLPDGYVMYDGSYVTEFDPPVVGGNDPSKATVSVKGTLYGILFKKSDLVSKFAGADVVDSFKGFDFTTQGLESLKFSISNLKDFSPAKKGLVLIHASGDLKLVGKISVDDLKKKLEGLSLGSTQDVIKSFGPVIESGSGELVPPWSKIPSDPSRITINIAGQ